MKDNKISAFKIGSAYIGVIVGAGFASGQEVLRFYSVYSAYGIIGLCISTFLFIIIGSKIMHLGKKLNAKSHLDIINHVSDRHSAKMFDIIITTFFLITNMAMISGSGAMLRQFYNIPFMWGCIIMSAAAFITVISGFNKVISSISSIVPLIFICILLVCFNTLAGSSFNLKFYNGSDSTLTRNWIVSALLYASYNIMFSISILSSLGAQARSLKTIRKGSFLGGIGLGIGALLIYFTLSVDIFNAFSYEIPMLYFAGKISKLVGIAYSVALMLEIYSTAVSNLYSLISRINVKNSNKTRIISSALLISVISCICGSFGFSNFVTYLYPVMGYCGFMLAITILVKKYIRKKTLSKEYV